MYEIVLLKDVKKYLAKNETVAKSLFRLLPLLQVNPYDSKLDIKKLKGYSNKYRIRLGKYRLLYEVVDNKVIIFSLGSRWDVYK